MQTTTDSVAFSPTLLATDGPNSAPLRNSRDLRRLRPFPSKSEVSDSEEERQRRVRLKRAALATVNQNGLRVIVISSDEEDDSSASIIAQKGSQPTQAVLPEARQPLLGSNHDEAPAESDSEELPPITPRRKPGQTPRARRIVLSSSSEDVDETEAESTETRSPLLPYTRRPPRALDDDVIDLTLSSPESKAPEVATRKAVSPSEEDSSLKRRVPAHVPHRDTEKMMPLFVDDSDSDSEGDDVSESVHYDPFSVDDGAILILDEPRSTQKPIRRANPVSELGALTPSTPQRGPKKVRPTQSPDSEEEIGAIVKPAARTTVVAEARSGVSSPGPSKLAGKAPRMTKKALQQLELERRRAYAETLFKELNEAVFKGGIPATTELQWNKRLLTTAGRAHWHKTKDGVHITSIQLAEKILDCDERIRNTLSHEMCHLACWIIDGAPNENHGTLFKDWARRVMRKHPEIEVTTRHNYEIKCKYEWKCVNCAKVYGRHSKSINVEEHACGVCKIGQLVPQFESRRAPKTPLPKAGSQNAAARSRDSPLLMPGAFPSPFPVVRSGEAGARGSTSIHISNDDDSDVELVTHKFATVRIASVNAAVLEHS